jgi:DNA-directed RNA polymerase specialized sigma24 family protein
LEDWATELQRGRSDAAWDLFVGRYRRLLFAAIRHYAQDYDDVMDVFARVCEALREDDLRRLRAWLDQPTHRARFSTWLVTVVRHLTIDWFRQRDGRRRLPAVVETLPPLQRRIFELVFLDQRSHVETYELVRGELAAGLSLREFRVELRETYRAAAKGRRGRVLRDLGGPPPPDDDVDDAPEPYAGEARRLVEAMMATLGPEDRTAVELYVVEGTPADQVARVLGWPNAKTVYNRVYRALAVLRERFERAGIRREDL